MREFFITTFGNKAFAVIMNHFSIVGLLYTLLLLLITAGAMTPLTTFIAEKKFFSSGKALDEKYSWQVLQSAFVIELMMFATMAMVVVFPFLYDAPSQLSLSEKINSSSPFTTFFAFDSGSFSLSITQLILPLLLLLILLFSLCIWRQYRSQKGLRMMILGLSALLGSYILFMWYSICFFLFHTVEFWGTYFSSTLAMTSSYIPALSFASVPFLWLCSVGVMSSALGSAVWLILRRAKADFGRDYYTFAMHSSVRLALKALGISTFLILVHVGLLALSQGRPLSTSALCVTFFAVLVAPIICWALLRNVSQSQTPMRHKVSIFCSLLCIIPLIHTHTASFLLLITPFFVSTP